MLYSECPLGVPRARRCWRTCARLHASTPSSLMICVFALLTSDEGRLGQRSPSHERFRLTPVSSLLGVPRRLTC
eukprot:5388419-Heterocapsa_arctica.AAC.1